MQRLFKVSLPLPPSVNRYQGKTIINQGRWSRIHFYPTEETEKWREYAATTIMRTIEEQKDQYPIPRHRYVIAKVKYYFNQRKEDADNYFKVPFDLLQTLGIVENDDQIIPQVEDISIRKDNPEMIMTLYLSNKYGIFDSEQCFNKFVNECCSICRSNKACKIRHSAIMNHLVEEIDPVEYKCTKQNILKKYRK